MHLVYLPKSFAQLEYITKSIFKQMPKFRVYLLLNGSPGILCGIEAGL